MDNKGVDPDSGPFKRKASGDQNKNAKRLREELNAKQAIHLRKHLVCKVPVLLQVLIM